MDYGDVVNGHREFIFSRSETAPTISGGNITTGSVGIHLSNKGFCIYRTLNMSPIKKIRISIVSNTNRVVKTRLYFFKTFGKVLFLSDIDDSFVNPDEGETNGAGIYNYSIPQSIKNIGHVAFGFRVTANTQTSYGGPHIKEILLLMS